MKELLVPVGNLDILKVAVLNGCDAVYLGGKKFGARAFANNFNDEELKEAVSFCHLYGVKIYITVNTLVYESELREVYEYLKFLNKINVDAVIVQDLGLISYIHDVLPDLEIHASTQVHTLSHETVKYLESLGVKRIVFAREMSLSDITSIETSLSKEIFIHGALCVSYSGECLMSSIHANRSGNRGECAGLCRLPYKLIENDKYINTDGQYLISMKDLNTSNEFLNILESDIYSLKIEGRMKSAEYVGCVTRFYRDLLDKYYNHEDLIPDTQILNDLKVIYNREFTKGFLFNEKRNNVVNEKNPNHIGTELGHVVNIDKKYIYIKLVDDICQGDGIRFLGSFEGGIINFLYNQEKLLEHHDTKGNIVLIDNKYKCRIGDVVNKTSSQLLTNKYTKNLSRYVSIDAKFIAKYGYMKLSFNDGINEVEVTSNEVFNAEKLSTTKEDVLSKLNKLGNTPFKLGNVDINIQDGIFISMSLINKMRQKLVDELISLRTQTKNITIKENVDECDKYDMNLNISVLVRNEEQLLIVLDIVDRIYVVDEALFNKYKDNSKIYYRTSRVGVKSNYDNLLVTELSNINSGKNGVLDYYINITNHKTNNLFKDSINTLSVELNDYEIENICEKYNYNTNFEIIIYGTIELMLMKYCLINKFVNKDDVCKMCLSNNKYYLEDHNKKKFRLLTEYKTHTTHLMDYKPFNKIDSIPNYLKWGIMNYRIELLDESNEEIINIIDRVKKLTQPKKEQ